jgi:hypothetical protein
LFGTTIISVSLVMGDTIRAIDRHYSYLTWGYADEGIFGAGPNGQGLYFAESVAAQIANVSNADPLIAGVSPQIVDVVQVFDHSTGIPQTNLHLVGSDANRSTALGKFTTTAGTTLAGPSPGQVLLDALAARDLNASVGDRLTLYGAIPIAATVQAVFLDDLRGGILTAVISGCSLFTDLPWPSPLIEVPEWSTFSRPTWAPTGGVGSFSGQRTSMGRCSNPGTSHCRTPPQDSVQAVGRRAREPRPSSSCSRFHRGGRDVDHRDLRCWPRNGRRDRDARAVGLTRKDIVLSYYFGLFYSAERIGRQFCGSAQHVLLGLHGSFPEAGSDRFYPGSTTPRATLGRLSSRW